MRGSKKNKVMWHGHEVAPRMGMKHVTTTRVHCRVTTVQVQDKQLLIKNKMGVSFAKQR